MSASTFADVASFGILVLVLIVRPNGLLGKDQHERVRIAVILVARRRRSGGGAAVRLAMC